MKKDELLVLTPRAVQGLLSLEECISAVEGAFRLYGEGKTATPAVLSMHVPEGGFHVKVGLLASGRSYFAAKVNGNFPANGARFGLTTIQGIIVLCDAEKGAPLAVMDSREITALRTAAATAVAAKYLARANSGVVTVCGCGQQGRIQLRALSGVCPLREAFAYDRCQEQAAWFARDLSAELQIPVRLAPDLGVTARQSDIIVTCTPSQTPLLGAADVVPGTFIAAVGADNPQKQELHSGLMARSKVVCDLVDQCAVMGDLHHALQAGTMAKGDVHAELGEVVAGKKRGRESEGEITVFDSTGTALQDVAAAAVLYEKAQRQGSGTRLDFAP